MTAVEVPPALSVGNVPSDVMVPFPAGLTRYIALFARPNTSPSGPTKFFG